MTRINRHFLDLCEIFLGNALILVFGKFCDILFNLKVLILRQIGVR